MNVLCSSTSRLRFTVRGLVLAIALLAMNLAIARSASRLSSSFHRSDLFGQTYSSYRGNHEGKLEFLDGSHVAFGRHDQRWSHPHMTKPPWPSLLRIWTPFIASVTLSVLIVVFGHLGVGRKLRTMRKSRGVLLAVVVVVWLSVPVIHIVLNPEEDYHIHPCMDDYFRQSVHETPFWPRYWRYLIFRPSPGDYACPLSPEWSIPPPDRTKEWLFF